MHRRDVAGAKAPHGGRFRHRDNSYAAVFGSNELTDITVIAFGPISSEDCDQMCFNWVGRSQSSKIQPDFRRICPRVPGGLRRNTPSLCISGEVISLLN